MSEIPEDVMDRARAVAGSVFNAYHDDDGGLGLGEPHLIVARAILAERERCATAAEITAARRLANANGEVGVSLAASVSRSIAAAIRSPTHISKETEK